MKYINFINILLAIIILLVLCVFSSLLFGSKNIDLLTVLNTLKNIHNDSFDAIVVKERIPRTIFSLLAGASLGISGTLMQSITRNPIADPSILGINMGASLFVVLGIAFLGITTYKEYIVLALIGGLITAIAVYFIASIGNGGISLMKLALSGVIISSILSSLINMVMLPRSDVMSSFRFWQVGSVSGVNWQSILSMLPFIIIGIILSIAVAPSLNALALGDEVAIGLGVKVGLTRIISTISAILLCSTVTALAGPIGFIGLMAPHIIRMLFGNNIKFIIPISAFIGGIILTFSDVIGRLIGSPSELEVGIVTSFIGAPIFIIISMKAKVRSL
ncbi:iron ABC transporter permease [uncultured Tyzzerella sp.]|uniref:FecCD family ABC transporter permease n=1 Tax=uncultured Tyzzerella sp. TaxID=2321398 RepID=UPI002942374C|nr:iron ABC transporter permease [uncultured Tyzzerella sp.]